MCTPLAIAGLALTAGSTVANTIAQGQVTRARNDALAAERIRQGQLDQEAEALNAQSRDRYDDFEGQQGEKASELGQYFTDQKIENSDANAAVAQEQTAPQSGSSLTVREEQKQRDKATAFTDQQGEALGNLRAFGDLLGGISRDQARDASQIGQIGGFKRGSSNVIPLELEAANQKGSGMRLFGDVLGLGGSLALNKGLSGTQTFSSTLGDVIGATPTSIASTFPKAPSRSLFNLYGAR
jgi:hypothetical protein